MAYDSAPDIETYIINNDRTLFSKLAQMYESAVVHLLARQEVEGISPTILRAFQKSYAPTAFRCRFPHCDRLSLGFATAELRLEHEAAHVRRMYCQTSPCPYTRTALQQKALSTRTHASTTANRIFHSFPQRYGARQMLKLKAVRGTHCAAAW